MADSHCLAIDAMGGDVGPRVTVPATFDILRRQPQLKVVLLGNASQIQAEFPSDYAAFADRLTVRHCEQAVAMDEKPSSTIRHKRESSMWHAVGMVANGEVQAAVSAGNTGALMAMSLLQLRTLPGISRPAICSKIPTSEGSSYLLDMGANLDCSAEQLHQFAGMASLTAMAVDGIKSPSVGLLNIGSEEIKGRAEIQAAAELFKADDSINYIGFVEGDSLFAGVADIVVCDGFSGNVALKSAEGVATMFSNALRESLSKNLLGRLAGLLAKPALLAMKHRLSPSTYNGASLLGLNGVVIKSHGGADCAGFSRAIEVAIHEAEQNLPALIRQWTEQ